MDELKQSVQLAVHEQKDRYYKFEAFNLFNGMLNGVNKELFRSYSKEICQQSAPDIEEAVEARKEDYKLSKDEFQIVKLQIVKLVKHNNDKLLKLLKRYAKDKP
jgi:preprotein translocase subunit SecA